MKWVKNGIVYTPPGTHAWSRHTALQPTPIVLENGTIRVYFGTRDDAGVSRVTFVDVDGENPGNIVATPDHPVLDIGTPGTFDDNGVVPCAIVPRDGVLYLYYAGYQIPTKTKFMVFGGLAISRDGGHTFVRARHVPVLDRTDDEILFRVAHSVHPCAQGWRVWYGGGSTWVHEHGKQLPVYDVRYIETADGINFPERGEVCVTFNHPDEYRIGRPFVFQHDGLYHMFYGTARLERGYRLGYAESSDGRTWQRKDDAIGLDISDGGWDGNMIAYPSVVTALSGRTYMFYNGNNMGRDGFGYATLVEW